MKSRAGGLQFWRVVALALQAPRRSVSPVRAGAPICRSRRSVFIVAPEPFQCQGPSTNDPRVSRKLRALVLCLLGGTAVELCDSTPAADGLITPGTDGPALRTSRHGHGCWADGRLAAGSWQLAVGDGRLTKPAAAQPTEDGEIKCGGLLPGLGKTI